MKRTGLKQNVIRQLRPGETPPAGEPRRYKSGHGYVRLRWKVGPYQYVETYEHRYVSGLPEGKHVHHRNGCKADNRRENLEVLSPTEHGQTHYPERVERAEQPVHHIHGSAAPLDQMRVLYESGVGLVGIGKIFGIHHVSVQRRLVAAGVQMRARARVRSFEPDAVADLYAGGVGIKAIARMFQVSDARVRAELDAQGVPRRRAGRPKRSEVGAAAAEQVARQLVYARSGYACERCDVRRAVHWHHRQNRSQGGQWEASNGMHLCAFCHHYVTVNPAASEAAGWTVPRGLNPAAVAVRLALHGLVLLTPDGGYAATEGVAA